ncbi:hypothetical protein LJK88_26350 [Paenibacillus sp. P26]|nr:hypothetical protein LJK88_26350 [Paenibacillus sp. P26]UUZ95088.1 hypothetical protein LJK87_11620 [Paenibacillus sp. P25]
MKQEVKRIYFLCGQNRCRSQMAEAFAKFYGGDHGGECWIKFIRRSASLHH